MFLAPQEKEKRDQSYLRAPPYGRNHYVTLLAAATAASLRQTLAL